MKRPPVVDMLRRTWRSYRTHDGRLLSGAVAFHALLATAPLGVLAIVAAGLLVGPRAARGELFDQLSERLGSEGAAYVVRWVEEAARPQSSILATVVSSTLLLLAGYRLFDMLRSALNHVWGVRSHVAIGFRAPGRRELARRALGFSMIFVLGAAVWVDVILTVALGAMARWVDGFPTLFRWVDHAGSLAVLTAVVTIVFRFLPDVRVSWRDALVGATATSVLVTVGSVAVSYYFERWSPASSYGAAGSVVALLLFIYYTAQTFFLGAEFTRVWADQHGHGMTPLPHAVPTRDADRQTIDFIELS